MSAATLVQSLVEFPETCEREYEEEAPTVALSPETQAIVLAAIRECRAQLDVLYRKVASDLIATSGVKKFVVPGLGETEIKKRTKRTQWRKDELLPVVVARIVDERETLYDVETGELLPYAVIGQNIARRLSECISFGAGKVTGLRAIGIQPDEFCTEEPDGYDVKLPGRAIA